MSPLRSTEVCGIAFQSGFNSVASSPAVGESPRVSTCLPVLGIKSQMLFLMLKGEQETERKRRKSCKWCATTLVPPRSLRLPEVEDETRMCCSLGLCSSRSSGVRDSLRVIIIPRVHLPPG